MRKHRVAVRFRAGPTWSDRGPPESQPGWTDHDRFIDDLVERGIVVMGGPYSDHTGAMVLLEGVTEGEAEELLRADPFVRNGVFEIEDVRSWTIFVDRLSR